MSRYPVATWRPIPEQFSQPHIRPTQFIFHRQVGLGSLFGFYSSAGVVVESQLWVGKDGRAEQYLDTTVRADANLEANMRPDGTGAVSCEFEGGLNNEPLTDAQIATAVVLLRQAHERDGIPLRFCRNPEDPGVGWHVMWGAPGPWTPVAKTCPTKPVIAQLPAILESAQGDDVTEADKDDIAAKVCDLLLGARATALRGQVRLALDAELGDESGLEELSNRIAGKVASKPVDVDALAAAVADKLAARLAS